MGSGFGLGLGFGSGLGLEGVVVITRCWWEKMGEDGDARYGPG